MTEIPAKKLRFDVGGIKSLDDETLEMEILITNGYLAKLQIELEVRHSPFRFSVGTLLISQARSNAQVIDLEYSSQDGYVEVMGEEASVEPGDWREEEVSELQMEEYEYGEWELPHLEYSIQARGAILELVMPAQCFHLFSLYCTINNIILR